MTMYSPDLLRQLQSRYLQNEWRYDKWGALGKVLLVQEVLHLDHEVTLEPLINTAFPRTFSCQRNREPLVPDMVQEYYQWVESMLQPELGFIDASDVAMGETAEKFCVPISGIHELIF
jgi:hypothetical protein